MDIEHTIMQVLLTNTE